MVFELDMYAIYFFKERFDGDFCACDHVLVEVKEGTPMTVSSLRLDPKV